MASGRSMLDFCKVKNGFSVSRKFYRGLFQARPAPGASSYYVVLPEVPPDTEETNSILRVEDYPKFNEIIPDQCISGSAKRSIEFDVELGKLSESCKESKNDLSFEKIMNPLEKFLVQMNYPLSTTKQLSYVMNNTPFKQAYARVFPQVENSRSQRWLSQDLYNAMKELSTNHKNKLDPCQQRMVDMYLLESRMCGIELPDAKKSKFLQILFRLTQLKNHFRNKVNITASRFSHMIYDFSLISEFPKDFCNQISTNKEEPSRGPWKLTLDKGMYDMAMAHCGDRKTRWNLWKAYNNRAAIYHDSTNLSNHVIIQEIRTLRNDIALMLGYKSFVHMSMETKMVGDVEKVTSFVNQLKGTFQLRAQKEFTKLQEFAKSEGFSEVLRIWDVPYWRRRQLDHLFKLDTDNLKNYFPLSGVLQFLFDYSRATFGLRFEDHTGEVEVWNEDVKFYKLYDDTSNEHLSAFYFDPYARPGSKLNGGWIESGRDRSDVMGITPFSYFCMNVHKPDSGSPCLLDIGQLQQLFYLFGHGLQQLATTAPYSEVSGQKNIERDALNTSANFMKMLLNTKETLRSLGRHHQSGEPLGEDVINTILQRNNHMISYDNLVSSYYSALDIEMHLNMEKSWFYVMENVWKNFMPVKLEEEDNHVCSFTPIFSDNYPAAFYSFKWSEMLAFNIFTTFEQAERNGTLKTVGKRYRDTILSLGGSAPASEVFRKFQGEDPNSSSYMLNILKKDTCLA